MQAELADSLGIYILGVNGAGHEAGNAENCTGRTLPWLQDTAADRAWEQWGVTYRDVVVLDRENGTVAVYNLTAQDLSVQANYDALKTLLIETAEAP